ncbi:hypothetical protein ACFL28_01920 [Candidatus Omnitrophota bacterium]
MKTILRLSIVLISLQLVYVGSICALEIKNENKYLIDARGDDGDIYLNRLSLHKKLDRHEIELSFFGEAQWNFEISEWEKLTLGLETGKFFREYLYVGQSVQFISGEILDYMAFDANSNSIDTTTKIRLLLPLAEHFSLRLFEEYALNLEKGRDESNEIGTEVIYSPKDSYSVGIGWHHIDRIHNFDTDYVSLSLTLNF